MSPVNGGINHYEKINMKSLNQQYESIKNIQLQVMKILLSYFGFFSNFHDINYKTATIDTEKDEGNLGKVSKKK